MPFKKTSGGKYKSPSGRKFTKEQVKRYYATDGFKKEPKRDQKLEKKKDAPDFKKNPMSAFRGKPKSTKKPSGKKR